MVTSLAVMVMPELRRRERMELEFMFGVAGTWLGGGLAGGGSVALAERSESEQKLGGKFLPSQGSAYAYVFGCAAVGCGGEDVEAGGNVGGLGVTDGYCDWDFFGKK